MKFYEKNKALSFVIMTLSAFGLGLWVALIILHIVNNQGVRIFENQLFANGYNACQPNFSNIPYGGVPYDAVNPLISSSVAIPPYGDLIVMNHSSYQLISLLFLFASGACEFIILVLAFFLLLKSRVPYRAMWYLANLAGLKTAIYVLSWFSLMLGSVYFGYTLTFFLNIGNRDCVATELKDYANGYFVNVIVGGVMVLFYGLNYVMAISVQSESKHLEDKLFRQEEQTKVVLQPLVDNVEAQRRVVEEELPNIPRINHPVHIEMVEQPPQGFQTNYASNDRHYEEQSHKPLAQSHEPRYVISNPNPLPSRFVPPPTHPQPNPSPYFYVPNAHQPLAVSDIEVNIQEQPFQSPPKQSNYHEKNDSSSNFLNSYVSPNKNINNRPLVPVGEQSISPGQKSRLKIFNRGIGGSQQKAVIKSLRDKYSRNY